MNNLNNIEQRLKQLEDIIHIKTTYTYSWHCDRSCKNDSCACKGHKANIVDDLNDPRYRKEKCIINEGNMIATNIVEHRCIYLEDEYIKIDDRL